MKIKEYNLHKTTKKTAIENNLVLADALPNNKIKRLFDFSLLDDITTYDWIKENIKDDAINNISPANKTSFVGTQYNQFSAYDGIIEYYVHRVYDKTGKRLYDIFQLAKVNIHEYERKSVYDVLRINGTIEAGCGYNAPIDDIEIA